MARDDGVDPALADRLDAAGFCRRVHPRLTVALAAYLGDRETAAELAQDALVRAWERWEHVAALESPDGWVFRVAYNLANSTLRRRSAERRARARLGARPRID